MSARKPSLSTRHIAVAFVAASFAVSIYAQTAPTPSTPGILSELSPAKAL